MRRLVALLALGFAAGACAQTVKPGGTGSGGSQSNGGSSGASSGGSSGNAGSSGSAGSGGSSSGGSSGSSGSGGSSSGGSSGSGGSSSGGSSGSGGTSGSGGATGMDPALALPNSSGTPCTQYGTSVGCSNLEVCRIYNSNSGRCETCDACGNLDDYCDTDRDCDILFQCYQHYCTNFCTLGSSECGAVSDCLDVGNNTEGICKPP